VASKCPGRLDVFALGSDHAVWEFTGTWHRVGGTSAPAPAAVRLASGETDLFIRGTGNALWMNVRAPGAAAWRGWRRIGGFLTSAPSATIWPSSFLGMVRTVLFLGRERKSADRPQRHRHRLGVGALAGGELAAVEEVVADADRPERGPHVDDHPAGIGQGEHVERLPAGGHDR
jgi:hypothetical protein